MKTKRAVLLDPVLRLRFLLVFSICCQPGSQKYLESLEWTPQNPKWVNNPLFFKSIAVMLLSCKQVSSVREQHDQFLLQLPVRLPQRWSNLLIINAVWLETILINNYNNGIYIALIHRCSKCLNSNNLNQVVYTCQLFLRYKREIFILGFLKTTRSFPKIPEEVQILPKKSEDFRSLSKTSEVCRRRSYQVPVLGRV